MSNVSLGTAGMTLGQAVPPTELDKLLADIKKQMMAECKNVSKELERSLTPEMLGKGGAALVNKVVCKELAKIDQRLLKLVAARLKELSKAQTEHAHASGFDPTKLRVFQPIQTPKPLRSGKTSVNLPLKLNIKGKTGKTVLEGHFWLGVDAPRLMKQEWNLYGGAGFRF